jgi:hypothetical protein
MRQQFKVLSGKLKRPGQRLQEVALFDEVGDPLSLSGTEYLVQPSDMLHGWTIETAVMLVRIGPLVLLYGYVVPPSPWTPGPANAAIHLPVGFRGDNGQASGPNTPVLGGSTRNVTTSAFVGGEAGDTLFIIKGTNYANEEDLYLNVLYSTIASPPWT